jgi:MFS family permease
VKSSRTFDSLHSRNYRLFFFGELVSHTGGWMHAMAEAWLVYSLTHSGTAVGAVFAFRFAPIFFFGLWGGAIADRFDRRRLLLITQLAQAALALLLWALVLAGVVHVWMVYALALAVGFVSVVEQPAQHAFVEEMVGPDRLANAVALNSAVVNSARITGPALAGLMTAAVGTAWVFFVDGISFIAVVVALAMMRVDELNSLARSKTAIRVRDGLAHAWSVRPMRSTIVLVAVVGTLVFNFPTFMTVLASDTFHGGAGVAGSLMAVLGCGTVIGALTAAHRARQTAWTVIAAGAALAAALIVAGVVPGRVLIVIALVPVGAFAVFFGATAGAHMQALSAPQFRGRVMAIYSILTFGATIVGGPLMGAVSQHWGARTGLATAGVATAVTAGALALTTRRGRAVVADPLAIAEATEAAVEVAT